MMTEQTGGPDGSLEDVDTFEQFAPLEMGGGELPAAEQRPVEQEQPEAQAASAAEKPAGADQQEQRPAQQPAVQQQQDDARRVPLSEMLDEREKRQAAQREADALRRQLQQFQTQQQQQRPEFWEQPEGNIDYRVQQAVQPLVQELIMQREQTSRALAAIQYGEDTVNEAYKDLETRIQSGDPVARFDYQRVMSQPNQYAALVQLHQQRSALAEVGNDLPAYREKLSQDLLNDPAFLARALEAAQARAKASPSVVTFTAPQKSRGVPSISNVGGAGSVVGSVADISDDDLFDKWTGAR